MLHYVKKYWYFALLGVLAMFGEVGIDLYQPKMMAEIVDTGILGLSNGGVPDPQFVFSTGIRMIFIVLCGGCCGLAAGVFANLCAQNFGNDMRKDCFRRIMHFSFSQTDKFSTGSLITRITSDTTQVQNMVATAVRGVSRSSMFLIGGTFTLYSLHASFGRILGFTVPILLAVVIFIVWKTNPLFLLLQKRLDRMNCVIRENIAGARVIKGFVQEDSETARFEEANRDLVNTQFRVSLLIAWLSPIMNIVLNLAIVVVFRVGAVHVRDGELGPGTIIAAVTYFTQILHGLMMLAMIFQSFSRGIASNRRLQEVLHTLPVISDGAYEHGRPEAASGTIEFDHVSFTYPGKKHEVLTDITLSVRSGETLAVIGATGSGKSTLVSLLPRFYDPTSGAVKVDGIDARDYPIRDLRSKIAIVLQKAELFSESIRENIALGDPNASEDEIREAARIAQAEDFILKQPQGYDTPVAEGGMSLSGGQKQRVSIARALLKKAEILILDDSTSALDLKTEAAFHEAMKHSGHKVTTIIIAQRIATVRLADRIAVLDGGRIAACAPHDELMETCEIYRSIYDSQMKREGEPA